MLLRPSKHTRPVPFYPHTPLFLSGCARQERGHFLGSHSNVVEAVRSAAHRTHQAINAVARKAEDAFHAPLAETFENEITHCCSRHGTSLCWRIGKRVLRFISTTPEFRQHAV